MFIHLKLYPESGMSKDLFVADPFITDLFYMMLALVEHRSVNYEISIMNLHEVIVCYCNQRSCVYCLYRNSTCFCCFHTNFCICNAPWFAVFHKFMQNLVVICCIYFTYMQNTKHHIMNIRQWPLEKQ